MPCTSLAWSIASFLYNNAHISDLQLNDFPMRGETGFDETIIWMIEKGFVRAEYARSMRTPQWPIVVLSNPMLTLQGEQFLFNCNKVQRACPYVTPNAHGASGGDAAAGTELRRTG